MPYHDPELLSARNRLCALKRYYPDDPATIEVARDFGAALLEAKVREIIDGFPPLTNEQRAKIVDLLRPPRGEAG